MIFSTLYRATKFAFQGFWRNIWLSIVTIIILILTLFSLSLVGGINVVANQVTDSIEDKVDVSVYFHPEIEVNDIQNIQYRFESLGSVETVTYISQDEAIKRFREKHADNSDIISSLDELDDNPLGASLIIKAKNVEDYDLILELLSDPDYEELIENQDFEDNQAIITSLTDISSRVQRVGIIVSMVFMVISLLIIFNTIRITIYTHREEIGIMKLVGASNWFVRFPFVIESMLYAIFGVVITMALLYPFVQILSPYISTLFEGYDFNLLSYFNENFFTILLLQFFVAVVLSMISSAIAVGKYLRV